MERVWQVNMREEELLFLTTLMALFHQYLEEDAVELARGLVTANAFAHRMGTDRYNALWMQLSELVKTSPQFQEFDQKIRESGL